MRSEVRTSFGGKRGLVWALIASWAIPGTMTAAYLFLMYTSETDNTGKAWEAVGLVFVFVLWYLFRTLTEHAAMARAVAVGDADRVLELAGRQLARRRSAKARIPFHVHRALALEIRGDWIAALAAVAEAEPAPGRPPWDVLAASVRVAALVETGQLAAARAIVDGELATSAPKLDSRRHASAVILANLARGRLLCAEGQPEAAMVPLQRVIDDVRTGSCTRGIAYHYAARCADARGDSAAATRDRARAATLAPASWVAA